MAHQKERVIFSRGLTNVELSAASRLAFPSVDGKADRPLAGQTMLSPPSPRGERTFSRLADRRHIKTAQPAVPELTLREYNTKPPPPPLALKLLLRAAVA